MENKRDRRPGQIEFSMNQVEAMKHLLDLGSPDARVEQGLEWMSRKGVPLEDAMGVATIVLNNVRPLLEELKSLKAKQPQSP